MTARIAAIAAPLAAHAAAGALVLFMAAEAAHAQEDEGRIEFNNHCRTCHTVEEGDHRLGPSLHNIMGREAGTQEGAAYSSAMSASTVVWDEETLNRFIEDPEAIVPGNNMTPFAGITDADVRAAIVGYLQAESDG